MIMRGNLDNSGRLVRFILRRERVISTIWIVALVLFSVALAPGMGNMFDDEARQALAETLKNPAMIAMMGPVYGIENYTAGAMYSGTMLLWMIIAVAVMNIFLVVRHTRGDEEKGRAEVVRSLPTGRLANLNATMITAVAVNDVLALLTGLGIAAMGVEGMGFAASMLYGAALGVSGLFFAAVAALFSQLLSSSHGAAGYSFLALGVFYMMRAAGDMYSEALSLASPLGLVQRAQVYVENHWWPVLIMLLETVVLVVIAYALNAVRDIDQGFIHARPGREEASTVLRSSFGLAFRLLRNTLIVWVIVMFTLGAAYGSILGDIETFVAESEFYQMIIGANNDYSTAMMFTTMVTSIMALICVIPVLSAATKLRSEEKENRAEHVLARAVTRVKYMGGYVALAFASSVLLQCATAFGLYASAAIVLEEPIALGFLLKANLVYLPALWGMIGVAVLLIGLLPKATGAIWAYFGFSFFTVFIGRLLELPQWLSKISPFGYIPQLPVDSINYTALAVLTVIAAVLTAAGFAFYKKRDTMV